MKKIDFKKLEDIANSLSVEELNVLDGIALKRAFELNGGVVEYRLGEKIKMKNDPFVVLGSMNNKEVEVVGFGSYFVENNEGVVDLVSPDMIEGKHNELIPGQLLKAAEYLVKKINKAYGKVDCYSVKGGGLATEDCDISIDVFDYNGEFEHPNLCNVIQNPYGVALNKKNLYRLKFVL